MLYRSTLFYSLFHSLFHFVLTPVNDIDTGTLITIVGTDFGQSVGEIGTVTVAGAIASVVSYDSATGELVVRSAQVQAATSGPVIVTFPAVPGRTASSTEIFRYVIPRLTQVSVRRGPFSGGTAAVITGEHIRSGVCLIFSRPRVQTLLLSR